MSPEANLLRFKAVENKSVRARPVRVSAENYGGPGPRDFPVASTVPSLPAAIREEVLELYAFLFCQGGFRSLGMTFEQFLLVVAIVKPGDLTAAKEDAAAS
jgi:hypothetical protein